MLQVAESLPCKIVRCGPPISVSLDLHQPSHPLTHPPTHCPSSDTSSNLSPCSSRYFHFLQQAKYTLLRHCHHCADNSFQIHSLKKKTCSSIPLSGGCRPKLTNKSKKKDLTKQEPSDQTKANQAGAI